MQQSTTMQIFIPLLWIGLLSTSCQSQKKSNTSSDNTEQKEVMIDVLDIVFDKGLKSLTKQIDFLPTENEFSEYLTSFTTREVGNFKIGDINP